mgnify:CR=1 FL=1
MQLDADQFEGWTKKQFLDTFRGKLTEDIEQAWAAIDKARPKKKRSKKVED